MSGLDAILYAIAFLIVVIGCASLYGVHKIRKTRKIFKRS